MIPWQELLSAVAGAVAGWLAKVLHIRFGNG